MMKNQIIENQIKEEKRFPEMCGEDADCSGCEYERRDGECAITDGEEKVTIGIGIETLREELSRGCDYAATQEMAHESFMEAMEELGGVGDWDEMTAEDLEG